MHKLLRVAPGLLAAGLAVGACGSGSDGNPVANAAQGSVTTSPPVTSPPATTATTVAAPTTTIPPATTTTAAAVRKVNANTASQSEIQAALAAAGVPSAGQWSREVVEYRPYPTNDPTFAKLRQNLAKYNPGPGVVDLIVSALSM